MRGARWCGPALMMRWARAVTAGVAVLAVVRCGDSPGPRLPADVALSLAAATFAATSDGADPAPVLVQITNAGGEPITGLGATVAYGSGEPTGWLEAELSGTAAPATLTVTASVGSLRGGTYTARVTVSSPDDPGDAPVLDVTFTVARAAPAPPSALTASAPSDRQVDLAWTDNSRVEDGFRIEWCEGEDCTAFAYVAGVDADVSSFTHIGYTQAGGTYRYRVQAVSSEGLSAFSNIADVTTPAIPPTIELSQSSITFTAVAGGVNPPAQTVTVINGGGGTLDDLALQSAYTGGAEGWLGHGLDGSTAPATLTLSATTGAMPAGTHTATVALHSAKASNSPRSISLTFVVAAPTGMPPAAPSDLMITRAFSNAITIAWTDNATDEDGFRIEMCSGVDCTGFAQIAQVGVDAESYSNGLMAPTTTYRFRVRAFGAGGNSSYSNVATVETPPADAPPAAPSDLVAAAISATEIELTWTDNSLNEYDFYIERAPAGTTDFARIASVTTNTTTYRDTGRDAATGYSYRVQGFNGNEPAPYSNTATATTPSGTEPRGR